MALIALTTDADPDRASVVITGRDFKQDGRAILIRDGDVEQLRADCTECNSGYDLRVGRVFRDHRNEFWQELSDDGEISLLPGNGVIIQTEEMVEFPRSFFGEIFPKVTLLQGGIANIPTKVDPGFRGNLLITVFNYGQRNMSLGRRQKFCSLHVFHIKGPIRPYDKPPPAIGARQRSRWYQRVGDWIDRRGARIGIIALMISSLAAILTIIQMVG